MEELVKKAIGEAILQVPSLMVLTAVVWMFINVILRFIKHIEDRGKIMEELHKEHIDARQQDRHAITLSSKSIDDNTDTMKMNTAAVTDLMSAVERLKAHCDRCDRI